MRVESAVSAEGRVRRRPRPSGSMRATWGFREQSAGLFRSPASHQWRIRSDGAGARRTRSARPNRSGSVCTPTGFRSGSRGGFSVETVKRDASVRAVSPRQLVLLSTLSGRRPAVTFAPCDVLPGFDFASRPFCVKVSTATRHSLPRPSRSSPRTHSASFMNPANSSGDLLVTISAPPAWSRFTVSGSCSVCMSTLYSWFTIGRGVPRGT